MKHQLTLLLMAFAAVLSFNAAADELSHYNLKLDDFHELKVVDGINVDYHCDPARAGLVEFDALPAVASAVIFEPGNGKLSIKLAASDTPYAGLPTVHVYSSFLSNVSNEGDSTVRVLSVAPGAKFSCRVMGNGLLSVRNVEASSVNATILSGRGMISIFGKCETATLKITGAGQIQADELQATDVNCTATGTGTIHCYATRLLNVGGLSGKVFYRGAPTVKKRFFSAVKVNSIDASH